MALKLKFSVSLEDAENHQIGQYKDKIVFAIGGKVGQIKLQQGLGVAGVLITEWLEKSFPEHFETRKAATIAALQKRPDLTQDEISALIAQVESLPGY